MNPMQIELIKKYSKQPIVIDQVQFNLVNAGLVDCGINVNMTNEAGINRDGGVLDYCRLNSITVQPWSPVQFGFIQGCFIDHEGFPEVNNTLAEIAEKYGVSKTTIAIAWLLRHPARMQPITGTTNLTRLRDCFKATDIRLTREEWYAIYRSAGNKLP